VPQDTVGPFEFVTITRKRRWSEVALWWPERRVLVCADVLGTAAYFRAAAESLAVHPLLRLFPPRDQLAAVNPARLLCGHGEGIHEDADTAMREALRTARRRIPGQLASAVRAWRATRPS
jgi:glyoxylase-like metal-dependent hydrolase (beta-lactamase superfamily II)